MLNWFLARLRGFYGDSQRFFDMVLPDEFNERLRPQVYLYYLLFIHFFRRDHALGVSVIVNFFFHNYIYVRTYELLRTYELRKTFIANLIRNSYVRIFIFVMVFYGLAVLKSKKACRP